VMILQPFKYKFVINMFWKFSSLKIYTGLLRIYYFFVNYLTVGILITL